MQQPGWMTHAWASYGEREVRGKQDNLNILQFFKEIGQDSVEHDETAWCAAFLGACLERAGFRSTRSLMARSYLHWGKVLDEPRPGAIAVLSRGRNTALGHVGFVVRATPRTLYLVGGNQSDQVNVSRYARSRLLGLRWPDKRLGEDNSRQQQANNASATDPASASDDKLAAFEQALAHVLEMEGGYTDDPQDPGGATNFGITIGDFARATKVTLNAANRAQMKRRLRRISPSLVRQIYLERYWRRASCPALSPALAMMHFDCAVNQGVWRAIRFLQKAAGAEVDGEIGPETLAAVGAAPIEQLLRDYADLRRRHYRSLPHFKRFGRGWLRRLRITSKRSKALIGADIRAPGITESSQQQPQQNKEARVMTKNATAKTGKMQTKWWGESMTIWGALLTAVTTVLPVVGPLVGLDITADIIETLGTQVSALISAAGGVIGTLMTIFGRVRATSRLQRREMRLLM